jgi:hypothetical protein
MTKTKFGVWCAILAGSFAVMTCGGKSVPPGLSGATVQAATSGSATPSSSKSPPIQSLSWRGKTKSLEIRAVNGPVRAVLGTGDEAEVVANVRKSKHATPLRLQAIEKGAVTIVCVAAAIGEEDDDDEGESGNEKHDRGAHRDHANHESVGEDSDACSQRGKLRGTAVDLLVKVPRGTKFSGWTVNGAVEAEGLEGEVEAHTQNGAVRIETSGVARASTVNGPIRAKIGAKTWSGTLSLESVNGRLEVELPADVGAELRADTVHGKVRVAPKMDAARVEENHVEGRLGKGGGELRLRTVNGPIDVR